MQKRRPSSYFSNLHETLNILIGFFKIDVKCSKEDNLKLNEKISKVQHILTIYGMETWKLIHFYHLERLDEQNKIEKSEDGQLTIILQIDDEKLHIEILNARNIRAMDSNGN